MTTQIHRPRDLAPTIGDTRLLINGERTDALHGGTFETTDPSSGAVLANVAEGRAADIDRAVAAARAAFDDGPWRHVKPAERARILWRLGDLILEHAEELAGLETLDNGKPFADALAFDIPGAAGLFHYMSGWATKLEGSTIPISFPGEFHTFTTREPVGVVGLIVAWNFPISTIAWKCAPALVCGNTVVLKPAEQTPLSALRVGELALEAGIPPGVLNVVPGFGADAGAALAAHPQVDKVSFTGSTATGRSIMEAASGNIKKLTLELGGKSPDVIFDDADIEAAIAGAASGIFANQGEICAAGSRLFIQEGVYDDVVSGIAKVAQGIKLGDGFDPATQMGPLVSAGHLARVDGYVQAGRAAGAEVVTGGERFGDAGHFLTPTVFSDVRPEMTIVREEIFGPVVVAQPFKTTDELITTANDTRFGLAAGVWTQDISKAHEVAHALRAGTVWVNCFGVYDAAMPFGGYKESGWGREMGHAVLDAYTESKTVCIRVGP